MIHKYLEADALIIDLGQIHRVLTDNYRELDSAFILDIKDKIEGYVLSRSIEPEVAFHKKNHRYVRSKLNQATSSIKAGKNDKLNFYFKGVILKKSMFSKLEHTAWLDENILTREKQSEEHKSKRKINRWWDSAFDIYSYDQQIVLPFDFEDEEFNYFFSWFFVLLNPTKIRRVFSKKALKSIGVSLPQVTQQLSLLAFKYPNIFDLIDWREKVRFVSHGIAPKSSEMIEQNLEREPEVDESKKMTIRRPVNRTNGDKRTALTLEETMQFFFLLQKHNVILKNNFHANLAKCVSGLTGFSFEVLNKTKPSVKFSRKTKAKLIGLLENLNN